MRAYRPPSPPLVKFKVKLTRLAARREVSGKTQRLLRPLYDYGLTR